MDAAVYTPTEWIFAPNDIEITDVILGRGAFGEVRVARWRNLTIACKRLHSQDNDDDHHFRSNDSWRKEISVLSQLRHPNLVLFLGICEGLHRHEPMILTELLPYSLYDLLEVKKHALDLPDVLDFSSDIINGLDYLHRHQPPIVHRDISSKNILIGVNKAKIADLGQAKVFGDTAISRQTGMPGAMAYAAPEVLTGKYSSKIDIFSFGVLLCQMSTADYPRIDRREDQLEAAAERFPILKPVIVECTSYQPHERPSASSLCQTLGSFVGNDRYYPNTRRSGPEKDVGVVGRAWMMREINSRCDEMNRELLSAKSLLSAEENRWQLEAGRVDGLNDRLKDAEMKLIIADDKLQQLQQDFNSQQEMLLSASNSNANYIAHIQSLKSDMVRLQAVVESYELQLASQFKDLNDSHEEIGKYRESYVIVSNNLDQTRRSEADLTRLNDTLRHQLEMQVEYGRDLEVRLEQALTRWKIEKEGLHEEKHRYGKLNNQAASIVSKNDRLELELKRAEDRLHLYDDLPLPDEIKMRFKDLQQDAQTARDEIADLLSQRAQWIEEKASLEQTIGDFSDKIDERDTQLIERDNVIRNKDALLSEANKNSQELLRLSTKQHDEHVEVKNRYKMLQEVEQQLRNKVERVEAQLKEEMYKNGILQRAALSRSSDAAAGSTGQRSAPDDSIVDDGAVMLLRAPAIDDDGEVPKRAVIAPEESIIETAQVRSVNDRTDVGIKHMMNLNLQKEGIEGVIGTMRTYKNDERVLWRGARILRDLILKSDVNKAICYDSDIEDWLLELMDKFSHSAIVQGHCMRLIGALAFGNDKFRRKVGEKGVMNSIVAAFRNHLEDQTVQLHVSTALTNLTHNSMENRSRFVELGGVGPLINMIVLYKDDSKLIRQACWAMLSLAGTDAISREIALSGGDSAIINAMLHHRFDAGVQQFGCWALTNMAICGDDISKRLKKKGVIEVCKIALETHPDNAEVLRQARGLLQAFSPHPATATTGGGHAVAISRWKGSNADTNR